MGFWIVLFYILIAFIYIPILIIFLLEIFFDLVHLLLFYFFVVSPLFPMWESDQTVWLRMTRSSDGKGSPSNSDSPVHTPKKVLQKLNSLKMGPFKSQNSVAEVSCTPFIWIW